jgi:hypothetical protein
MLCFLCENISEWKKNHLFLCIVIFGCLYKLIGRRNCCDTVTELKASSISTETEAVKMEVLSIQGRKVNSHQVPSSCTHFPANAGSSSLSKCLKWQQLLIYNLSTCFHVISCTFQGVSEFREHKNHMKPWNFWVSWLYPSSGISKNTLRFGNWICFRPQV